MSAIRKNVVIGMVGVNGTGKTTIENDLISKWRAANPYKSVVGFDQHHQLGGLIDFYINPDDKYWAWHVWKKCKNSMIVLDDYKSLVTNSSPPDGMRQIFIDRRLNNNDIIYSCHGPANIIPMLTDFTTHYYIFHTKTAQGRFSDRMANAELCIGASIAVNKYVTMYGMGIHPSKPEFNLPPNNGQRFPYIIVDTEDRKLRAINMHQKLSF